MGLVNGTNGVPVAAFGAALLEELEQWEPSLPVAWRPNETVPAEFADVLGLWHWGATPYVFACEAGDLVARRRGVEMWRFGVAEGRIVGIRGYHAGEQLHVVRRRTARSRTSTSARSSSPGALRGRDAHPGWASRPVIVRG